MQKLLSSKLKLIYFVLFLLISFNLYAGELARIIKISDGDTFIVLNQNNQKIKLRLMWIDTPEKYSSKKLNKDVIKCNTTKKEMIKLGKLATSYAKKYFADSKNVEVDYYGKGYYNRRLAVVYKKGYDQPYNFEIIRNGYACIYKKAKYPKVLDKYLKEAKKYRRGLWAINPELMSCLCK
ncbi:thermonuclease (plasmid) [Deferribacter desulfuricans SSM1]|uniref:Thermonuclease n=1 Tax=Deferribacter desulfuricans (strain DSM 14783 / JCM 11476 / NBRC 101012 / SSM1) TaxID=639282 RepID=D3PET4_DEFDS|nr:thermonuclease family protein [Deferribacter desulfuricans]BAI81726.1 thermonuclease [Deferribacter desulfuricans SSM1]